MAYMDLFDLNVHAYIEEDLHHLRTDPQYANINFFDFLRYIYSRKRYCLRFPCSTCGNIGFRTLLRELGDSRIAAMLNAVTRDGLEGAKYLDWPRIMACFVVHTGNVHLFEDSLIYKEFLYRQKMYQLEKVRIQASEKAREEAAAAERARRKQIRPRQKEESDSARCIIKDWIGRQPLEKQLQVILADRKTPSYYGIDFDVISEEELREVPKVVLLDTVIAFRTVKDPAWKAFQGRIRSFLAE